MMKKDKHVELDSLINAVISLYLNLIRLSTAEITKREIDIIDNIIQSTFKKEVALQQIQKLIENPYPIEQSASIIQQELLFMDKVKLMMNLLVIAFMDNDFSILERHDMLEIVELLQIDIRLYDQMIGLISGASNYLEIPLKKFTESSKTIHFYNYLLFGEQERCDVMFRAKKKSPYALIVLIIEDFIFIGSFLQNYFTLNREVLESNRLYRFDKSNVLSLIEPENDFQISYKDIMKLYHNKKHYVQDVIKYSKQVFGFQIFQDRARIRIQVNKGNVALNGITLNEQTRYELAINDSIVINDVLEFTSLDILTEKLSFREERVLNVFFIEPFEDFFQIRETQSNRSIVKLTRNENEFLIQALDKNIPISLNYETLATPQKFILNQDVITIHKTNFKVNRYFDLIKIDLEISKLQVNNLRHIFRDAHKIALNDIHFTVNKSEILAVMGPSGSGKTTLLKCLIGEILPREANIEIDGYDFYENFSKFQKHLAYVPQDDLLFNNLTVFDNLYYCGRLRLPHLRQKDVLIKRIENILNQIGLADKQNMVVGSVDDKRLSGGERKRLNIALELLSDPLIVVLDEPISGLSSKDSEKIIEMLTELKEQGKMIIATIHQPNPDIFQQFDNLLLIDQQGTQVYFGDTNGIFDYFDDELEEITFGKRNLARKKELKMAEYMFDIMQYPLLDRAGKPIYKKPNSQIGVLEEQRKYPPDYWKAKYKKFQLLEMITKQANSKQASKPRVEKKKLVRNTLLFRDHIWQIYYLFMRNWKNKLMNRSNLYVTFLAAPLLSFLISFILRYSEPNAEYEFAKNVNISIFIFISIIVFIFLGLSNSLDEIISEKRIIIREKKLNVKSAYFLIAKNLTLPIFAFIQSVLYYFIAAFILELRGSFVIYVGYQLLAAFIGYSLGLLASSLVKDKKAIINVLPIILIPQIIFAGAVVKFEEMNRRVQINPESVIPEFVQLIPSRWLFEGLFTAQAKLNFYTRRINSYNQQLKQLRTDKNNGAVSQENYSKTKRKLDGKKTLLLREHQREKYINEDISFAVDMIDGKFYNHKKNYFLASKKIIFNKTLNTYNMNLIIIFFYGFIINLLTYISIKFSFQQKR
jgi:ABC-type multidrug transport system ATPase subunit